MKKNEPKEQDKQIIVEESDLGRANELALSRDFRQPEYCRARDCYIFIRKKR